ncbi:nuclear transport factor 2 family protein [Halomarina pelagica]|uniref:nuclear transport factor 2 family protein n=1 Tax=Halomarina pelagica TaxID=2961599 RepID=UPI0020C46656|nr:nuclear transport factor 2 family protein [Halomarina sp. BND7]
MDAADLAREYYRAIDEADYDALATVLAPDFVHDRPDRTIEGRDAFVRFMREERPDPDTTHELDAVFLDGERDEREEGRDARGEGRDGREKRHDGRGAGVACEGRVLRADGGEWFRFVDVFAVEDGALAGLTTYAR